MTIFPNQVIFGPLSQSKKIIFSWDFYIRFLKIRVDKLLKDYKSFQLWY